VVEAVDERQPKNKDLAYQSQKYNAMYSEQDNLEFLEALVAIDNLIILFINTMAAEDAPRYKVYCRDRCLVTNRVELVSELLRDARAASITIRGIAYGNTQYCSLYPRNEQPNFAGACAIGHFA
jgi:hypothetical protein